MYCFEFSKTFDVDGVSYFFSLDHDQLDLICPGKGVFGGVSAYTKRGAAFIEKNGRFYNDRGAAGLYDFLCRCINNNIAMDYVKRVVRVTVAGWR